MLSAVTVGAYRQEGDRVTRSYGVPLVGRSFAERDAIVRLGDDLTTVRFVDIATRRSRLRVERLATDAYDARVRLVLSATDRFRLVLPTRSAGQSDVRLVSGFASRSEAALLIPPGHESIVGVDAPLDVLVITLDVIGLEDVVASGGAHLDPETLDQGVIEQDLILAKMASAIRLGLTGSATEPFFAQLVFAAVLRMTTLSGATTTGPRLGGLAPWQERRAKDLITEDLAKTRPIIEIARACNLSLTYFSKAFKISTGVTPHQWLQTERISRARRLLKDDTPLAEVAAACGFADQSHFSKIFKREAGFSPSVWRRLNTRPEAALAEQNGE